MAGNRKMHYLAALAIATVIAALLLMYGLGDSQDEDDLPYFSISGSTELEGNFYISFVYSSNIIMLDGKGNIVYFHHEDEGDDGVNAGFWDFKKHVIDGKIYYSYHDQDSSEDKLGIDGFAPGDRVILDAHFNEVKRIRFEQSDIVEKGHPLDGHDFYLFDLDHYIMSGYIRDRVYNIPGYPDGSNVIYSYLQEVKDGEVVWDFRTVDYPELYSLTVTDAVATANDFANEQVDAPDYVHFNAMRVNDDGDLVVSYRHLNSIICLDRTAEEDQIKWILSGKDDMFGLTDDQKTSSQHYVTVDGDNVTVFDNHNITGETRICSYDIDTENHTLVDFHQYRVDGKFTAACGSAQLLYGETYVIGWGHSNNDYVCLSVYDFAKDEELFRMTLDNNTNFTYRCVYYD